MSRKPENTFIASVHKYVAQAVYRMKNNNQFNAGIADVWYSGSLRDLWVEYKFIPKITPAQCALPALSELQKEWLDARLAEGRNVAVIVGSPDGGVLYLDQDWHVPVTPQQFKARLQTRRELAEWINGFTQGGP